MPKSKSGYKRPYTYEPPPGVQIEIKTEEVYQILVKVSKRNHCTIGHWSEANLRYAMSGKPYIPPARRLATATPTKRPRSFQISETLYEDIERQFGEDKATDWMVVSQFEI